jgi:hypothetical protein
MKRTMYTCDRCHVAVDSPNGLWQARTSVSSNGNADTLHYKEVDLCRQCLTQLGFGEIKTNIRGTAATPAPGVEDLLREIFRLCSMRDKP